MRKYRGGEEERKLNINEAKDNKKMIAPVIRSAFAGASSWLSVYKSEIFAQFKNNFNEIDESKVHKCYFCSESNCYEIWFDDLKQAKKDNKFKHK